MFPYMTGYERNLIQYDYEHMLLGEGSSVTIKYLTPLIASADPDPDPVYKYDRRVTASEEQSLPNVQCFMQVVTQLHLRLLSFGLVQEGDAIFYFLKSFNLLEPIAGKPAIPETLYIVDPVAGQWAPKLGDIGPLKRYLMTMISNMAIAEVVPCELKK